LAISFEDAFGREGVMSIADAAKRGEARAARLDHMLGEFVCARSPKCPIGSGLATGAALASAPWSRMTPWR
jgi:hypothetical protein